VLLRSIWSFFSYVQAFYAWSWWTLERDANYFSLPKSVLLTSFCSVLFSCLGLLRLVVVDTRGRRKLLFSTKIRAAYPFLVRVVLLFRPFTPGLGDH